MRVPIRLMLTLLLAVPVCLALILLFVLEARKGSAAPPASALPAATHRPVLGPRQMET
jgi:hypothetical protein